MAEAMSTSFDEWIRSLLNELQSDDADMSDFVQYLMGIVISDSETDEEKQVAISELLSDLDLKHDHNIENLSQQILDRWYQCENQADNGPKTTSTVKTTNDDDDPINNALINAMNQMESIAKQQNKSFEHSSNKANEDSAFRKHKSQVLAKYSEISDEEIEYEHEEENDGNGLFQNTNAQTVEEREKNARALQHETHKKQQERNKTDANNQKQKDEERKKKAQQRAQKQERRR